MSVTVNIPSVNISGLICDGEFSAELNPNETSEEYSINNGTFTFSITNNGIPTISVTLIAIFRLQTYTTSSVYTNNFINIVGRINSTTAIQNAVTVNVYQNGTLISYSTIVVPQGNKYFYHYEQNQQTYPGNMATLYGHAPLQNEYLLDLSYTRLWIDSENATDFLASHYEEIFSDIPVPGDTDPYSPGGGSGPGGGEGDFDGTSDTVPVPSLPSISITDSGFLTLFKASQSDLRSLANYLWSNLFSAILPGGTMEETITTLKKVVANPYDAILGCSIVPVSVGTTTAKNIKMYGVLDSGISLPVVSSQYAVVDCGTLNIKEFWQGYLDYSPYTKVTSLYLPYIGVVSIDVDQIMGTAVQIIYHIDILSGQCIAYIVVDGSVEFQYQGHCSTAIPITSVDYTSTIQSGLSLVGSIANIGAGMIGAAAMPGLAGVAATAGAAITGAAGQAGSIANAVMGSKPDIKSGSGVGGMGGLMSVQTPFLIIERPRQSLPEVVDSSGTTVTQKHWTGYPSNVAVNLSNITGYVEVARINVNKMTATAAEKDEITALLSGGVYIA